MPTPPLHPEATTDPRLLRWVTSGRQLPAACPELTALVADGTLERVEVGRSEVRTLLAATGSWRIAGPRVRSALLAALRALDPSAQLSSGELRSRVEEIIEREVAPFAGTHGGTVTVESVVDGVLTISFGGTCAGCDLRGRTLHGLIATAVQAHCPQIREVRTARRRRFGHTSSRAGR